MSNFRRWLIRGVFLFLLLLCVGGWVWSYVWPRGIYFRGHYELWCIEITSGVVYMGHYGDSPSFKPYPSIDVTPLDLSPPQSPKFEAFHFLGFYIRYTHSIYWLLIGIPFWFPTTLSLMILYHAYRKAPKLSPATAFPVETSKGVS